MQDKREAWNADIAGIKTDNLVFLDESGVNTDMTRIYGRALSNQRVADSAPLSTPITTTVLASIRTNGQITYDTYQGGTTATRFKEYLEHVLLPALKTDDVIVMDNMRSHHAKIVRNLLDTKKIKYLYLPPYSPDLNPIEKMWSKCKSILRKLKVRLVDQLPDSIRFAICSIRPQDCCDWFHPYYLR